MADEKEQKDAGITEEVVGGQKMSDIEKDSKSEDKSKSKDELHADAAEPKKQELQPVSAGLMHIKVYSPYQTYFDKEASSISAVNDTGPFDILTGHHKFLTLLAPCELDIITPDGDEKIKISRGIMYVKEDRVTVFLDV